ncbi:rho GTPase-activating protein 18 [Caerostris darwini]|uniref:Rho GTPase-activating protein 18 n=1 Tax=Caerostris darwini TaxID=1538125 RepID=A0AAV4UPF1_9ARAC|nr:rho GTPase-activating protein 18 [Caerostris darwini]
MHADLSYEGIRISGLGTEEMLFNSSSPEKKLTQKEKHKSRPRENDKSGSIFILSHKKFWRKSLEKILHHLHSNGLREEGLMRLAGSVQKVQILKAEIERSYVTSPTLVENLIRQSSVHDVSVLLKQLMRHLPEPLLTNSHMDCFLQVPNIPNVQDQINTLNLLVLALPDCHRELLQELFYFLAKVVEEEDVNRMSIGNVAMIVAPNLFPPPRLKKGNHKQNDIAAEVTVAAMSSKVTQLLIKYGNFLGAVPPELLAQARLQNRRSSNKHAKRMGRKQKGDKQKNLKDTIRSEMHKYSVTVSSSLWVVIPVDRPRSRSWVIVEGAFQCGLLVWKETVSSVSTLLLCCSRSSVEY